MAQERVHRLFLSSMSVIYLFAFASLYHQLPGMYGENGILPVSKELTKTPSLEWKSLTRYFMDVKPTLLWITQSLKIDLQAAMDILALAGIFLSSLAMVMSWARNMLVFGLLWLLYLSFYSVGSVFLWFQWDALLMEAGFLAFIFAPIPFLMSSGMHAKFSGICMWPVKWLFFRLMFMSGIVKMQSNCPTWWKLTALHHHYESQCLPTFLGWYIHQLPGWFDSLTVLHALFSEIVVPFLFFAPTRGLKKFAFYNQVVLQIGIIITGNYNFFNLLAIVLSLSLLEDQDLGYLDSKKPAISSKVKSVLSWMFNILVLGGLFVMTGILYNLHYDEKSVLKFKAGFTEADFNRAVSYMWPVSVGLALFSIAWTLLKYFLQNDQGEGTFTKYYRGVFLGFYMFMVTGLFALSLSPYSTISRSTNLGVAGQRIRATHQQLEKFNLVNGYGLFRRMTGVDGRPELILEGSNNLESGWKPYEFEYKPGRLDRAPPFVIPHQPRLDWQMWFAALGDKSSNPWVQNLVYRLLKGQPEVIRLLDPSSDFVEKPPKYIRGQLYKYWFTDISDSSEKTGKNWWRRQFAREWLSPVSLDDDDFMKAIRAHGLTSIARPATHPEIQQGLNFIRMKAESVSAPIFIWSLFMVNVVFQRMFKALSM